jgi:hypothetical protein
MKTVLLFLILAQRLLFASYSAVLLDANSSLPVKNAIISDSAHDIRSDANGSFFLDSNETLYHVKAYGYRPYSFSSDLNTTKIYLRPIKVKALYLTFWGASNNSKTLKNILELIDKTEANAIVVDIKNEYGSTLFLTSFKQANSYGAHNDRTNRDIKKFMKTMKEKNIYTIARIVTFKDELQAVNNLDYAIKRDDANQTIWRNHDNIAWVDPFDERSHDYTISIAEEAAKVGFDEINFDYIRFPAKKGLLYSKKNSQKNRIKAIGRFLDKARARLRKYGVFISVDTYGNICWAKDDNGIGQTVSSLASHADYLAPMLYPSGFSSGSFYFKYPSEYPYVVVFRSIKTIRDRIPSERVRPWLQYFRDYTRRKKEYKRDEIQAQIRATEDAGANGWMMWSPSSKYSLECLGDEEYCF